ncbi:hypothetical protein EDD85DRAFT_1027746 [Armillaria nabsnona]|nr:hypothetical protein EDD85DRAFT_1027746 [Armillaria nabsnona]
MLSSEDDNWRRRLFSDAQAAERSYENKDKDNDDSANLQFADAETDVHVPLTKMSVFSQLWRALLGRVTGLFDCVTDSASIFSNDASSVCSENEGGMYLFGPPPSDTMPVAVFSNDLTSLPAEEIGDPLMFYDELKALKRIEEEHHERVKRAVEKTRELDDALYDKLTSKARASSPVAESISTGAMERTKCSRSLPVQAGQGLDYSKLERLPPFQPMSLLKRENVDPPPLMDGLSGS